MKIMFNAHSFSSALYFPLNIQLTKEFITAEDDVWCMTCFMPAVFHRHLCYLIPLTSSKRKGVGSYVIVCPCMGKQAFQCLTFAVHLIKPE